jgi:hypothetical protein
MKSISVQIQEYVDMLASQFHGFQNGTFLELNLLP